MTEENKKTEEVKKTTTRQDGNRNRGGRREHRSPRKERVRPEFDQKILSIRRVTRVVSGGRRLSFSVTLVAGDRKGSVGVGMGKAIDTSLSIEKAFRDAKKNMVKIPLTKNLSIPHEVRHKFCGSDVFIMPVFGNSVIAGSAVRDVLELAGVHGVSAKVFSRSRNKTNIARATVIALSKFMEPLKKK